jgi:hypothetical protein
MTVIKASFRWSANELLAAHRAHYRHSPSWVKIRRMFWLAVACLVVCGLSVILRDGSLILGTAFFAFALGVLISPLKLRRMLLKHYAQRPDRDTVVNYEFTPDQIVIRTEAACTTLEWRFITRVLQTSKGFLLYPHSQSFHWVPVHGFPDNAAMQEFLKLAKSKVRDFDNVGPGSDGKI